MKTAFRIALTVCLAAGLFAFPSQALADDPPPTEFQVIEGVPLADSPNTYYKTLTGLDFHPSNSDLRYSSTNGGLYPLALVAGFGYYAAFTLPSDASVTGITFFVVDNDADSYISLGASRFTPATHDLLVLCSTSTSGAVSGIQSINLSDGLPFTIDNSTYAYHLRVEFHSTGDSQILYGARITYTIPSAPPSGYQYVTMAGANFRSSSSNMTHKSDDGGTLFATALDSSHYFYMRLDLPTGSVISEVKWFVIDNHASHFDTYIISHSPATDNAIIEVSSSSTVNSPDVQVLTRTDSITIDNNNLSYLVSFSPGAASSDLRIVGARVRYTLPTSPDLQSPAKTFSGVYFSPTCSDLTYRVTGYKLYALALSSGRSFQASLNLPSNVQINKISFYFIDNSVQHFDFAGWYYFPPTGTYSDRVSRSSIGATTEIRTISFSNISTVMGVMDTYDMVSRLRAEIGAAGTDMYLVGATVEYSYPKVYLPILKR